MDSFYNIKLHIPKLPIQSKSACLPPHTPQELAEQSGTGTWTELRRDGRLECGIRENLPDNYK